MLWNDWVKYPYIHAFFPNMILCYHKTLMRVETGSLERIFYLLFLIKWAPKFQARKGPPPYVLGCIGNLTLDILIAKHFTVVSIKTSQTLTHILYHSQHDSFKDSFKGTHAPSTFDLASYQEEKIISVCITSWLIVSYKKFSQLTKVQETREYNANLTKTYWRT